jgi:hypothetical protein
MLRRKTIIVLVITLMVTVMVAAFSFLYISQILRLRIAFANELATSLTHQLAYAANNAVPDFSSTSVDTSSTTAVRRALADYVQTDVALNNLLQSDPGDFSFIYDVSIAKHCFTPMQVWWGSTLHRVPTSSRLQRPASATRFDLSSARQPFMT